MARHKESTRVRPRLLHVGRVILPLVVIGMWLAATGVGGPYFGKVSEVSTNDSTAYLPTTAEATQVQQRLPEFLGEDAIPAILVVTPTNSASGEELSEADLADLTDLTASLANLDEVEGEISPPIPSQDGQAAQIFIPLNTDIDVDDAVETLRSHVASQLPEGLQSYVTGPAGFLGDLVEAFGGIDLLLLLVAVGAVLVILVVVYRSPILPFLVLTTSIAALTVALLTVWWLAKAEVVLLSGQTQGILFILVIGATTDYSLLYVARFREGLLDHSSRWRATRAAWRGSLAPIVASGSTVIAGLLCLLLSELQSNRDLGPIASIGIAFAMLAALSLLPALLMGFGRVAFWPRAPKTAAAHLADEPSPRLEPQPGTHLAAQPHASASPGHEPDVDHMPTRGVWAKLPQAVQRNSRPIWVVTTLVLLAACTGVAGLKANGVAESELVLGPSEARDGQTALGEHFPGGSGSPMYVIAPEEDLQQIADAILDTPGVESLAVHAADSPSGTVGITHDGLSPAPGGQPADPTTADGDVLLQATLAVAADSAQAGDVVTHVRDQLEGDYAQGSVLVGGVSATDVDSNNASIRDRTLIIPVVLVVIMVILMILLRSIVAPLMLITTVVISFGSALGVAAVVFNHVFDMPGADPAVPLYGFVFLVALGIDYNIFLMTRVREESLQHGTHAGITRGLAITGGVITSAGLVLAATFAALAVIPILFLLQVAFIVAFGVLLDTIVVRSILVPALSHELGARLWWPSKRIAE